MFQSDPPTTLKEAVQPRSTLACVAFLILALIASLFFQKVNAEFFALSGLCLIVAFVLSIGLSRRPSINVALLPLALLFGFWAWVGLATALSPVTFISLGTFWTLGFFPVTAITILLIATSARIESFVIGALLSIVAVLALYACVSYFVFDEVPRATFANKNNLAALQMPMAFYAGAMAVTTRHIALKLVLLALAGLFTLTIGIIGSRGVLICLVSGFLLMLMLLWLDRWPRKSTVALLATVLIALMASNIAGSGNLVKRTETILAPASAGNDRFIIWESSWELAKDAPWHGIGPGLYPMVYSQYRLDDDKSAAFFVHNDYLQFQIEAGWPATVLMLAALLILAWLSIRHAFFKRAKKERRLSLLIPLFGAGAIAGHSMLSFNLFLPSLLIMIGVMFGLTTHHLRASAQAGGSPSPERPWGLPAFLSIALLALFPAVFFLDTGRGALLHERANELSEQGQFGAALKKLEKAAEVSPSADIYHYSLAWLAYRQMAEKGERADASIIQQMFQRLDTAESLNPLRPQIHVIRARLLEALGDPQTGENWKNSQALRDRIEVEYRQAISEDPFHLEGRFYLARFLLQQNRLNEGQSILEAGINKPYEYSELSVNYYRLTAEMRRILGDQAGYEDLLARLKAAVEKHQR